MQALCYGLNKYKVVLMRIKILKRVREDSFFYAKNPKTFQVIG